MNVTAIDLLLACVKPSVCGCWIWQGALSTKGYGRVTVGKQVIRAHGWGTLDEVQVQSVDVAAA